MKLLIVDDESRIRTLIAKYAAFEGYAWEEAADGMEAIEKARDGSIGLVILDIMMPELDGFSAAREIRKFRPNLPIILLSARGEEYDKIHGFELDIDDYVVKPFSTPELMARVKAMLRRAKPEVLSSVLRCGDIELDRETHRVHRKSREVRLGPTEFRLLEFLMASPGRVFSRSQLLDGVWGHDIYVDERTVDVHVGRLRKALNFSNMQDVIRTVRGAGYSMEA